MCSSDLKPDIAKSRDSALGIGVPGSVAGLSLALEKYGSGKFTLAELLKPVIALARDGFVVTDDVTDTMPEERGRLARWPSAIKIFSRKDGTALQDGDQLHVLIVRDDIARIETLLAAPPEEHL